MKIIPVIDIKNGMVVRPGGALRADYQPWRSPLCPNAGPAEAVAGFLALFPFETIYIADLDAIEGGEPQLAVLAAIAGAFPGVELWVDGGFKNAAALTAWRARRFGRPVAGSETVTCGEDLRGSECILSLDFRGGRLLGDAGWLQAPSLWPPDVIVMSLERVGRDRGPDLKRLIEIRGIAPGARLWAAGGIRGARDLEMLRENGVCGALAATALHTGRLDRQKIEKLMTF